MGHLRTAADFVVRYKDVFHLKTFYRMLNESLAEDKYATADQSGHEYMETLYLEKYLQKGIHAGGKELWIYWRAYKLPEGKYSAYLRFLMNIDIHLIYGQDQDIMHEGKKIKVQWGEIEVFVKSMLETDYQGKWHHHWLLKHLQHIYDERILAQETVKRLKEAWRDAYKIQAKIKDYLNLRNFLPTAEAFHPVKYGQEG